MKKSLKVIAVVIVMVVMMSGCGTKEKAVDLTGKWVADGFEAEISEDNITVYWSAEDVKSLYWAGSYTAPNKSGDSFSWTSENDHSQTDNALMASTDDTKEFTYEGEEISFEMSALGTTATIRMKKAD